jgi:hypothetical protein
MTGPPRERGSVRNVTVEGDDRTYFAEVRALPKLGLKPGDHVWIEFGGAWAEERGRTFRVPGVWQRCVVLPSGATTADVRVRFAPPSTTITQE